MECTEDKMVRYMARMYEERDMGELYDTGFELLS